MVINSWGNSKSNGAKTVKSFSDNSLNQQFQLDPQRVLQLLQLVPVLESANEITLACPFHKEGVRPNLGLNRHTGLWNCWVCGAKGNLPKLVQQVRQISYRESLTWLQNQCGLPSIVEVRDRNLRELEKILNPPEAKDFVSFDITPFRFGSSWWVRFAGFDRATTKNFRLGYDSNTHRGVIPIAFRGKWVSIIKRASNETQQPRYLYEQGFDRGRVLYPWDSLPKRSNKCILVEGPRDAIRLHSYGITEALAQLGSGITANQLKLIVDNFDEVWLWQDNDTAGHMATFYIAEQLESLIPRIFVIPYLVQKKDPNELTQAETLRCIRNRIHWSALI